MKRRLVTLGLLALVSAPSGLGAQGLDRLVLAGRFESYTFDPGLGFTKVTEFTVPVGLDLNLGRPVNVTLSSGYARIELTNAAGTETSVDGVLDTEVRLALNVVPGKLIVVATGVIPTGIKTIEQSQLSLLGAISSDVIGFAAPTIGSGGSIGGGLVGAVPVGRFALGLGATYKHALLYEPIVNDPSELQAGAEVRVRAGLEGPLGRTTYLRLAGVFAARGKDQFGGQTQNGVGNRIIGYFAINQGVGNAQITVYAFDVYRSGPRIEATALGAAVIPKGNVVAAGTRIDLRFGRGTRVTPRAEYRLSSSASADDPTGSTRRLGNSFRFGLDLRQQVVPRFALVLQGDGVIGEIRTDASNAFTNFDGFRVGLFLEVTP